ncbi:MAG: C45 family autoproteolytic acyltransferase/hydrolase [Candidatus Latescibacteria bacterium]|jgi:hypothetical protein|nr:C45 family autoproteolytic acyltransferase/hydrolase [Candidatus Latescibacterota bacterium]
MLTTLDGTPYETGLTMGKAAGAVMRRRVRVFHKKRKSMKVTDAEIRARVKDFTRRTRKVARHWLDEAKGLADGARVDVDDILILNCPPPGAHISTLHSCTSFLRIGRRENVLLKIRDERHNVQSFAIVAPRRRTRFHAARDIGNLGVAHAFNQWGVAAACDTGSATDRVSDEPRFNDCHLLRMVAEKARSVDEIPALFKLLIDADVVGGAGPGRGAIFLFVDPSRGMLLECESRDFATKFVDRGPLSVANHFVIPEATKWASSPPGANTLVRRARMAERGKRAGSSPDPLEVFDISRDRKTRPNTLCNVAWQRDSLTVSAQVQVVDRSDPSRSVNYVCCGNTRNSVYLPVPIDARSTFLPLMNGRFYAATDALLRVHGSAPHLRSVQRRFERRVVNGLDYRAACREGYALLRRAAAEARARG